MCTLPHGTSRRVGLLLLRRPSGEAHHASSPSTPTAPTGKPPKGFTDTTAIMKPPIHIHPPTHPSCLRQGASPGSRRGNPAIHPWRAVHPTIKVIAPSMGNPQPPVTAQTPAWTPSVHATGPESFEEALGGAGLHCQLRPVAPCAQRSYFL
jgi:hypothetical protein